MPRFSLTSEHTHPVSRQVSGHEFIRAESESMNRASAPATLIVKLEIFVDRRRPRLRALKPCSLDDIVHAIPLQALCHTQFVIPTDVKRARALISARVGRRDPLFLLMVDKFL